MGSDVVEIGALCSVELIIKMFNSLTKCLSVEVLVVVCLKEILHNVKM